MFERLGGEYIGGTLADLGNVRTDPYSFSNPVENLSPSSIAMFPLKASLYYNVARSGWAGFKYIAGIPNNFSQSSLRNKYRMGTFDGLIGSGLRDIKNIKDRFFEGETFAKNPYVERKPWKIVGSENAENLYSSLAGSWEAGMIDRFMVGKSSIGASLATLVKKGHLSQDDYESLIKDNNFVDEVVRNRYIMSDKKILKSRHEIDIDEGKYGRTKHMASAFRDHGKKFDANLSYRNMNKKTASIWSILTGKHDIANVAMYPNVSGETRFMPVKMSMPWNRGKYAKAYNTTYAAYMQAMQDKGNTAIGELYSSAAYREAAHTAATSAVHRMKIMNVARGAAVAAYAIPAALDIVTSGFKAVTQTMERTASTLRSVTQMEFGSDTLMQSGRMASERQRAVAAIQNSHMNARYLMGNEATLYH